MFVGLGFIIFVHELGHFVAAKSCGVKVEAFYVGFNVPFPKVFGITIIPQYLLKFTIGETEYGIGNLPLGGYVKMLGQEDTPSRPEDEVTDGEENAEENGVEPASEADSASDKSKANADDPQAPAMQELDPRDYRAKSVVQRFWIISAGVIMNMLTAPLFALFAYWYGVPEMPARVGTVLPGGPAYVADFRPGDKIVQMGETEPTAELSFSDFAEYNALIGADKTVVHYIERKSPDGSETERIKKEVVPSNGVIQVRYRTIAAVGVRPDVSTRLPKTNAIIPYSAAAKANPPFEDGDVIMAVNGIPVEYGAMMRRLIAAQSDQPVEIEVARLGQANLSKLSDETPRIKITVPPRKRKMVGLHMEYLPIVAVQENSPAAEAGLKPGEKIVELNGKPIVDPITFRELLREFIGTGQAVQLTLLTGEERRVVEVTPRKPFFPSLAFNRPISIDELGVAFKVSNVVQSVGSGSPAEVAGVLAGDRIIKAEFVATPDGLKEEKKIGFPVEPYDLSENEFGWPLVESALQNRLSSTVLKLTVIRDKQEKEFELKWVESDQYFADARGIQLNSDSVIVKGDSLTSAFALGLKKVRKDIGRIYSFLQALVTGKVSMTSMGGPLTIGNVAVNFAMEGPGLFLAFLAFISVNLAIVNFLPIPILDGGHAAFLLWEGVTGKPVNENTQFIASFVGFLFLISLMIFVFSLDILTMFF